MSVGFDGGAVWFVFSVQLVGVHFSGFVFCVLDCFFVLGLVSVAG